MKEKDVQKKYMEFQMLNQQIKQSQAQLEALQEQASEMMLVNQNLDDFKEIEKDTEILVQINGGIFAKAVIKDTKNVKVNIGSDVAVKKDVDSTQKLIEEQIEQIKNMQTKRLIELQSLAMKAEMLEQEISKEMK